jgi:hypothetical protein
VKCCCAAVWSASWGSFDYLQSGLSLATDSEGKVRIDLVQVCFRDLLRFGSKV